MACRSRSRCWWLTPTSRASFAVGTPCAMPRRIKRIWPGRRCTLPGGAGKHVEDSAAAFAAVVEDRRLGAMAMDVQPVPGGATGAGQAAGMEQVQELVVATILVHQVEDREVHEVNSQEIIVDTPDGKESTTAGGLEGLTTKLVT